MLFGFSYLFAYISGVHKNFLLFFFFFFFVSTLLSVKTFLLGFWHLHLRECKNNLIKNFDSLKKMPAIEISQASLSEFKKIKVRGTINRNKKIFFPSKTLDSKVGIRIASEFIADSGEKYLIDEGWFVNSKFEYFKNNSDIFREYIVGYIRYPREPKMFTPNNNIKNNEWYTYDLKKINKYFSSSINQNFFIKKMNPKRENFLFHSNHEYQFRNNHLQYAITWFCMSFVFFIMFLVFIKKNKK